MIVVAIAADQHGILAGSTPPHRKAAAAALGLLVVSSVIAAVSGVAGIVVAYLSSNNAEAAHQAEITRLRSDTETIRQDLINAQEAAFKTARAMDAERHEAFLKQSEDMRRREIFVQEYGLRVAMVGAILQDTDNYVAVEQYMEAQRSILRILCDITAFWYEGQDFSSRAEAEDSIDYEACFRLGRTIDEYTLENCPGVREYIEHEADLINDHTAVLTVALWAFDKRIRLHNGHSVPVHKDPMNCLPGAASAYAANSPFIFGDHRSELGGHIRKFSADLRGRIQPCTMAKFSIVSDISQ